jgi:hypothetical protein
MCGPAGSTARREQFVKAHVNCVCTSRGMYICVHIYNVCHWICACKELKLCRVLKVHFNACVEQAVAALRAVGATSIMQSLPNAGTDAATF